MERDRNEVIEFLAEARELLTGIETELLRFEKLTDASGNIDRESLDTLFRYFHTIKGSSGFFGLTGVVKIAHAAENLLDYLRIHPEAQDKESLELFIEAHDILKELFDTEESEPSDGDLHNQQHWDYLQKLNLKNELIRKNKDADFQLTTIKEKEFEIFSEVKKKEPEPEFEIFIPFKKEKEKEVEKNITTKLAKVGKKDLRIDTDKLDSLLDLVGEIVIAEPMVTSHPDLKHLSFENFNKASLHLKKLVRNLQEVTLSLRMVPIAGVFSRMERLVRDTAKKTGKQVNLRIIGEDTEIDKSIVEEIYDPLVHILRNAIDHGLETTEERKEAGKNPVGTIELEAIQSGKEVWISASDDGKGLNKEKIISKAKGLGLLREGANELTDKDVWDFLFHPGFSTASEVTDLSGRGVGLDVVRKNVNALKGFVDVHSSLGEGTTFLIRVPLTLAIIEGMVVRKGDGFFILPCIDVKETFYLSNAQFSELYKNNHMFSYRDVMIPIADLDLLFGNDSSLGNTESFKNTYVLVVESEDKRIGIPFDEIIGNQSIVIKPISSIFKNISGLAGCTVLGNGQAGLILDVRKLISNYFSQDLRGTR
ncbi:chemotaxis protein CheA [Leptospira ilyithenensis]|uniref:Chemotaxis protein CheA n=1 Tax=Leptospira ilyithenensis TaxID=2484901 RepID=A0A4R9LQX4_9LEPT|nr:chemotaxis protein CheA [Leptospira ilyithenensis]TGN10370.1 chemotaxis protein CheA [Leptospira ilyithenensis]